jgi:predicted adenine nucleotide alpha hydrolase (AANH) superfamily ATPase
MFNKNNITIKDVSIITTVVAVCLSGYFFIENNYASSKDFEKVKTAIAKVDYRLDIKILEDDLRNYQKRLWQLEREKGKNCDECQELKTDIEIIREKLRRLRSEKGLR